MRFRPDLHFTPIVHLTFASTCYPFIDLISVVVAFPSSVLGKRIRDVFDGLLLASNSKLATNPPSDIALLDNYGSLQREPAERILDDRPRSDLIPPVSLLYEGFGQFLDIFCGRQDIHHMSKEQQDLKRAVDRFAEQMTLIYGDEESRRTDGLLALNNILSLGGNNNKLMPASIGSVNTDGHYDGPLEAAACIIEFRNDLGAINSIPVVELTSYVAHSHALAMKRYESAFRNWRVPCLGITVVGKSNISGSSDESDMMYINEVLVLHHREQPP